MPATCGSTMKSAAPLARSTTPSPCTAAAAVWLVVLVIETDMRAVLAAAVLAAVGRTTVAALAFCTTASPHPTERRRAARERRGLLASAYGYPCPRTRWANSGPTPLSL